MVSGFYALQLKSRLKQSMLARKERERAQTFLQTVIDGFPEALMVINTDYTIALAHQTVLAMAGARNPVINGLTCHQVSHDTDHPCIGLNHPCLLDRIIKTQRPVRLEHIHRDDRREERFVEAQKMEAIGTLAGGIAHDFNNILSPLIGYAEILKLDLPTDNPMQKDVDQILKAALRSKDLVTQILAFSRQKDTEMKPLSLQPIVKEVLKLLRSSIPTTIAIEQDIDPNCKMVIADPTQVHQIVMNLATNVTMPWRKTVATSRSP